MRNVRMGIDPVGLRVCEFWKVVYNEGLLMMISVVPDASHMVPIRVGDYIEYSGVQLNGETICYTITVNIDIRTSGNQPGFVRVEDTIIGIADANANVEEARHRV
jgi:hypothetical protein